MGCEKQIRIGNKTYNITTLTNTLNTLRGVQGLSNEDLQDKKLITDYESNYSKQFHKNSKAFGINLLEVYNIGENRSDISKEISLHSIERSELIEGESKVTSIVKNLGRRLSKKKMKYLFYKYSIVKEGDAVFSVGDLVKPDKFGLKGYRNNLNRLVLDGDIAYIVEMAIKEVKPVFVYHQNTNDFSKLERGWYTWDYQQNDFVPFEGIPQLTENFIGVGSERTTPQGVTAINELFNNYVKSQPKNESEKSDLEELINNDELEEDSEDDGGIPYSKEIEDNTSINSLEDKKVLVDLANELAGRSDLEIEFIDDPNVHYKGKLSKGKVTINLAKATLDTPIHEILGHPFINHIKNNDIELYNKLINELENTERGKQLIEKISEKYKPSVVREEALVTLLGELAAEKIRKNSWIDKLIYKFKEFIRNLFNLPISNINSIPKISTLNDVANLFAYGKNPLVFDGSKPVYTTADGKQYNNREEASFKHNKNREDKVLVQIEKTKDFLEINKLSTNFNIKLENKKGNKLVVELPSNGIMDLGNQLDYFLENLDKPVKSRLIKKDSRLKSKVRVVINNGNINWASNSIDTFRYEGDLYPNNGNLVNSLFELNSDNVISINLKEGDIKFEYDEDVPQEVKDIIDEYNKNLNSREKSNINKNISPFSTELKNYNSKLKGELDFTRLKPKKLETKDFLFDSLFVSDKGVVVKRNNKYYYNYKIDSNMRLIDKEDFNYFISNNDILTFNTKDYVGKYTLSVNGLPFIDVIGETEQDVLDILNDKTQDKIKYGTPKYEYSLISEEEEDTQYSLDLDSEDYFNDIISKNRGGDLIYDSTEGKWKAPNSNKLYESVTSQLSNGVAKTHTHISRGTIIDKIIRHFFEFYNNSNELTRLSSQYFLDHYHKIRQEYLDNIPEEYHKQVPNISDQALMKLINQLKGFADAAKKDNIKIFANTDKITGTLKYRDKEINLVGEIDLLLVKYDKNGNILNIRITDVKTIRNKKISDATLQKYELQLNAYAHMFQQSTNLRVGSATILFFNIEDETNEDEDITIDKIDLLTKNQLYVDNQIQAGGGVNYEINFNREDELVAEKFLDLKLSLYDLLLKTKKDNNFNFEEAYTKNYEYFNNTINNRIRFLERNIITLRQRDKDLYTDIESKIKEYLDEIEYLQKLSEDFERKKKITTENSFTQYLDNIEEDLKVLNQVYTDEEFGIETYNSKYLYDLYKFYDNFGSDIIKYLKDYSKELNYKEDKVEELVTKMNDIILSSESKVKSAIKKATIDFLKNDEDTKNILEYINVNNREEHEFLFRKKKVMYKLINTDIDNIDITVEDLIYVNDDLTFYEKMFQGLTEGRDSYLANKMLSFLNNSLTESNIDALKKLDRLRSLYNKLSSSEINSIVNKDFTLKDSYTEDYHQAIKKLQVLVKELNKKTKDPEYAVLNIANEYKSNFEKFDPTKLPIFTEEEILQLDLSYINEYFTANGVIKQVDLDYQNKLIDILGENNYKNLIKDFKQHILYVADLYNVYSDLYQQYLTVEEDQKQEIAPLYYEARRKFYESDILHFLSVINSDATDILVSKLIRKSSEKSKVSYVFKDFNPNAMHSGLPLIPKKEHFNREFDKIKNNKNLYDFYNQYKDMLEDIYLIKGNRISGQFEIPLLNINIKDPIKKYWDNFKKHPLKISLLGQFLREDLRMEGRKITNNSQFKNKKISSTNHNKFHKEVLDLLHNIDKEDITKYEEEKLKAIQKVLPFYSTDIMSAMEIFYTEAFNYKAKASVESKIKLFYDTYKTLETKDKETRKEALERMDFFMDKIFYGIKDKKETALSYKTLSREDRKNIEYLRKLSAKLNKGNTLTKKDVFYHTGQLEEGEIEFRIEYDITSENKSRKGRNSHIFLLNGKIVPKEDFKRIFYLYIDQKEEELFSKVGVFTIADKLQSWFAITSLFLKPASGVFNRFEGSYNNSLWDTTGAYWTIGNLGKAKDFLQWTNTKKFVNKTGFGFILPKEKQKQLDILEAFIDRLGGLQSEKKDISSNSQESLSFAQAVNDFGFSFAISLPEFKNQSEIVLSILMDYEIEVEEEGQIKKIKFFDGNKFNFLDMVDGQIVESEKYKNQFSINSKSVYDLQLKIQSAIGQIQGNYLSNDILLMNKSTAGRLFTQFKKWFFSHISRRFNFNRDNLYINPATNRISSNGIYTTALGKYPMLATIPIGVITMATFPFASASFASMAFISFIATILGTGAFAYISNKRFNNFYSKADKNNKKDFYMNKLDTLKIFTESALKHFLNRIVKSTRFIHQNESRLSLRNTIQSEPKFKEDVQALRFVGAELASFFYYGLFAKGLSFALIYLLEELQDTPDDDDDSIEGFTKKHMQGIVYRIVNLLDRASVVPTNYYDTIEYLRTISSAPVSEYLLGILDGVDTIIKNPEKSRNKILHERIVKPLAPTYVRELIRLIDNEYLKKSEDLDYLSINSYKSQLEGDPVEETLLFALKDGGRYSEVFTDSNYKFNYLRNYTEKELKSLSEEELQNLMDKTEIKLDEETNNVRKDKIFNYLLKMEKAMNYIKEKEHNRKKGLKKFNN